MDMIKADEYQIENYYVLVEKNSNLEELIDVETLGIYNSSNDKYEEALTKLSNVIFSVFSWKSTPLPCVV